MRDAAPPLTIEARDLTLDISGQRLIHSLNLRLATPGITVIMGPNGAGKSLLLRLLHGLINPTSGTIRVDESSLTPETTRRQALVFQSPVLLRRSVAANIDFVIKARGATANRDDLLAQVGLAAKARLPARALSGGEQQRLALARALVTAPDILMLDEPTASLDPASVQMIETIVQDTAAHGTRVIFVTHDIAQARRLADSVAFMSEGKVTEHCPKNQFFTTPTSPEARAFLDGRLTT